LNVELSPAFEGRMQIAFEIIALTGGVRKKKKEKKNKKQK